MQGVWNKSLSIQFPRINRRECGGIAARHAYHGRIKDTLSLRHASPRSALHKAACFRCNTSLGMRVDMDFSPAIILDEAIYEPLATTAT